MDSLITSAALALARGDFFDALNRVALRDDPPALALRGIAMAQLGELERAKFLLRKAIRAFGPGESVSKARCTVAKVEIALATRDLDGSLNQLENARQILDQHGDALNAAYAQQLKIRVLLLFGHLDEAEALVDTVDVARFSPALKAVHELVRANIAIRRLRIQSARIALERAQESAHLAKIPSLLAEIERAFHLLHTPAARLSSPEGETSLLLEDVETLLASDALVVDACRYLIRHKAEVVSLCSRPVLFNLVFALSKAWPEDVARDQLIKLAFRHKQVDDSLRARLRVEVGRLRAEIATLADIKATKNGFKLVLRDAAKTIVLEQPIQEKHTALLAILADGESWSSSALALVLGTSQRSVQRALESLAKAGKVQSFGSGQARRWVTFPLPGITTILLLPGPLPGG